MEGVLPVDVYIPPVSSGVAGIFPALNTELDNVTATRLGLKQYLHGTTYNGGNAPTVAASTNVTAIGSIRAIFIPYQCQDGTWRLKISIRTSGSTTSSATTHELSINDVVAKNNGIFYQPIGGYGTNLITQFAEIVPNTGTLTLGTTTSGAPSNLNFWGDVELERKPNWAY